jgi:LmbE family N-acetylglucosaminyl deacetylase
MKYVQELFTEATAIGSIEAHDDDYGSKGHIEPLTRQLTKHLITLTPSNNGTKNFAPHTTDIRGGGRMQEGRAGAEVLGYQSFARVYAPDGQLAEHADSVVATVAEWIRHYNINLLLSTRRLHDHRDHIAAGNIALRAARLVADEDDRSIDIVEVHPSIGVQGSYLAETTPESRALLHAALAENRSQFRYAHPDQSGPEYMHVTPDLALHQKELGELSYYPIQTDATYTLVRVGNLAVAQAELITV